MCSQELFDNYAKILKNLEPNYLFRPFAIPATPKFLRLLNLLEQQWPLITTLLSPARH
jgi:hypothetical protein